MQPPVTPTPKPQPRRSNDNCCDDLACDSGLRNNYYDGKRLTADMFKVEQRYLSERRQLVNRALYGVGVVYGFGIEAESLKESAGGRLSRRLRIRAGLAFDGCGRELVQGGIRAIDLDDVTLVDEKGKQIERDEAFGRIATGGARQGQYRKPGTEDDPVCWLLSAHYAEQRDGHVTIPDPCQCDRQEWDHICETVRYTLRRIPCDECCVDDDCGLGCNCGTGRCCEPQRGYREEPPYRQSPKYPEPPPKDPDQALPFRRGGCRCICDHVIGLDVESSCTTRLVEIEESCGRVWVDLKHGVPIACLGVIPDDCGGWTFGETVDVCGPRPLVKRNDVLFDLIRGCDLSRIKEISWADWHRRDTPVDFKDFAEAFGQLGSDPAEFETTFQVTFSRPVREETLKADCFAITIVSFEPADRGWQTLRVPIVDVITDDVKAQAGDPAKHVRSARLVVGRAWIEDGLNGWGGPFNNETWVEIEVRGDFILDCNGQPVDANAVGLLAAPTGNGTPGGTFLSTFCVSPRPPRPGGGNRYEPTDRSKGASS